MRDRVQTLLAFLAAAVFVGVFAVTFLHRPVVDVASARLVLDDGLDRATRLNTVSFPARTALAVDLATSQPVLAKATSAVGLERSDIVVSSLASAATSAGSNPANARDKPLLVIAGTGGRSAPIVEVVAGAADPRVAEGLVSAVARETVTAVERSSAASSTDLATTSPNRFRVTVLGPRAAETVEQRRGFVGSLLVALVAAIATFGVTSLARYLYVQRSLGTAG